MPQHNYLSMFECFILNESICVCNWCITLTVLSKPNRWHTLNLQTTVWGSCVAEESLINGMDPLRPLSPFFSERRPVSWGRWCIVALTQVQTSGGRAYFNRKSAVKPQNLRWYKHILIIWSLAKIYLICLIKLVQSDASAMSHVTFLHIWIKTGAQWEPSFPFDPHSALDFRHDWWGRLQQEMWETPTEEKSLSLRCLRLFLFHIDER